MKNGIALSALIILILFSLIWLDGETKRDMNGVADGTQTEVASVQSGNVSNQMLMESYMKKLEELPINEEVLSSFMGTKIVSQEVSYVEDLEIFQNEIVVDAGKEGNIFYTLQLYAVYQLELNEDETEWGSSEGEMPACLEVRNEVISENISGGYYIYDVSPSRNWGSGYDVDEKYLISAKISPYEFVDKRPCGEVTLQVNGVPFVDSIDLNIVGYLGNFFVDEESYLLCDYENPINWTMESGDYRFTNKENPEYIIELMYKLSTNEILIIKTHDVSDPLGMSNEISVYKLVKKNEE